MVRKLSILFLAVLLGIRADAQKMKTDGNLPIVVLPASPDDTKPMVLMITGDGGWKNFDPKLAKQLVGEHMPVVALNALHYFWTKKTPEETAATVQSILNNYMRQWGKRKFILVGFSFGADVMPFIVNRLPQDLLKDCAGVALFSPGRSTDFEIHLSQMMSDRKQWKYDVVKEIEAMKPVKLVCFFGEQEHDFPVKILSRPNWQVIYLPGGHHYEDNTQNIGKILWEKIQSGS